LLHFDNAGYKDIESGREWIEMAFNEVFESFYIADILNNKTIDNSWEIGRFNLKYYGSSDFWPK